MNMKLTSEVFQMWPWSPSRKQMDITAYSDVEQNFVTGWIIFVEGHSLIAYI